MEYRVYSSSLLRLVGDVYLFNLIFKLNLYYFFEIFQTFYR